MNMKWWQNAVMYQIYPKSFQDSNGDGIGDLKGIIRRLDYLEKLGIDAVWLSPVNASPMRDNGYDISDYYTIDPSFGSNEDMYQLIDEAKKRGIRIIMDLVVNHCSNQHKWFQKALENPEGEYGDYFYFRKGNKAEPPNNWRSIFGGSAWEKIPNSDYYYLHIFAKEQVDLNWENPRLREEIYQMMNFWLEKGISGFRLDAITYIKKEEGLPSFEADADDGMVSVKYGALNRPGIEVFLKEMKEKTYGKYDSFTVGEVAGAEGKEMLPFISLEDGFFSSIFEISHVQMDLVGPNYFWCEGREWDVDEMRDMLFQSQLSIQPKGWLANAIENHDMPRAVDYLLKEDGRNFYGASMLAALYLYMRGTPFIYQGQEIGMRNFGFERIEDYDDCSSINQYYYAIQKGFSQEEALEFIKSKSRDNTRYPISWNNEKNAGFTDGKPWLPINPNYTQINIEAQERDEKSLLSFYRKLIALKKDEKYNEILAIGDMKPILEEYHNIFAYERRMKERKVIVICNYQGKSCKIKTEHMGKVLLNNYDSVEMEQDFIVLKPYQVLVFGTILNWGIMGGGNIASTFANAIENLPNHNLVAVASKSRKTNISTKKHYSDYDELVRDEEIDAIYVATIHPIHYECVIKALEAGKPVLCEKPLGITELEAQKMIASAKENKTILIEAMWTRTLPAMKILQKICRTKRYGDIEAIRINFGTRVEQMSERLLNPALGGGALLDIGVYGVHVADFLIGEYPLEIKAAAEKSTTNVDTETLVWMKYPCGARVDIRVSMNARLQNELFVSTENADFVMPYFWRPDCFYRYEPNKAFERAKLLETYDFPIAGNGYEYEAREMEQCIYDKKAESVLISHESSLRVMKILDEIRRQCGVVYPQDI